MISRFLHMIGPDVYFGMLKGRTIDQRVVGKRFLLFYHGCERNPTEGSWSVKWVFSVFKSVHA